ncbi:hypothetical protein Tsubulata_038513 [Turnera subulata]|uniref:SGNH hydrolase-type esterase domain-containing protein n=1 Tax=Turnera subulata TaxID=218843 RepID=A0A9Q0FA39_9ROSI|nr:hypothetical protein Tsubulata_038513 [Turnera subulata]
MAIAALIIVNLCIIATRAAPLTKLPTNILVFGDSTVDTGNNNYAKTLIKGNYHPYGHDFPNHTPTGRFSNGKLIPDFVASTLDIKDAVPPFLDPSLSDDDIKTGVCFASAGAGYDDLTNAALGVVPLSKQLKLLESYISRLKGIVGEEEACRIIGDSLILVSAGTNDFIVNYYDLPTRKLQFTISEYQDFLLNHVQNFVKELYKLGGRSMVIAGIPPIGCIPIQRTFNLKSPHDPSCLEDQNADSQCYNEKLERLLHKLKESLPNSRIAYANDLWKHIEGVAESESKETKKMAALITLLQALVAITITICGTTWATSPPKFPTILAFGDSTLDTGNNNYVKTLVKADSYPYGLEFPNHFPTGRFSDGKLVTDFGASLLGIKETVPPFLDPKLSDSDIRTGVCFASAGSGYDDLTNAELGVIPVSKQVGMFKNYISRLRGIVGEEEANRTIGDSLILISSGSNDFIVYYDVVVSPRRKQFNITDFQDFVQNLFQNFVKNADSKSYNEKLVTLLPKLEESLPGSRITYVNFYDPALDLDSLKPAEYLFFDSIHPTQAAYKPIADVIVKDILAGFSTK